MSRILCTVTLLALGLLLSGGCASKPSAPPITADFTNSIGMKFNLIPAGEYMMGSPKGELSLPTERPQHKVHITKPFYLGVTEVTQEQYEKVMGKNPSRFSSAGDSATQVQGMDTSSFPVERVSWEDAEEFCQKLTAMEGREYRLPTEAQWEYACRAGTTTEYCFGDDAARLQEYGWYGDNADKRTHPVAQKKANAWGLYDMHGNVWEWCADWYDTDYYCKSPLSDPPGAAQGTYRVDRGGCWRVSASVCRSAYRGGGLPIVRNGYLGLRVATFPSASHASQESGGDR